MIVIGYGTGRCGTQSLASFLNQQEGFNVTHEKVPLGWTPFNAHREQSIKKFISTAEYVIGDIGYYWVNHIDYMLKEYPKTKVINITRKDEEVIESFWTYKAHVREFVSFMENEWFGHPYHSDRPTKDAIARMVKWYRYCEKELKLFYPDNIYQLDTYDLNNKDKLIDLLNWLGVEEMDLSLQHIDKKRVLTENAQTERPS